MEPRRLIYTIHEACQELHLSRSSLYLLIRRRLVSVIRKGRRVYISHAEVERLATAGVPAMWPPKQNGRTTLHFAPAPVTPPRPPGRRSPATKDPDEPAKKPPAPSPGQSGRERDSAIA